MEVQLKDIKYIIDHKSDYTPLEVALARYAINMRNQHSRANDERATLYNCCLGAANTIAKAMEHLCQKKEDAIISNPPFRTPQQIVDFVNGIKMQ